MTTLETGKQAEDRACKYLEEKGFAIIARNVLYKVGEIDIVAMQGEILCFVEVRSRKNASFSLPETTIDFQKQSKIIKAAQLYLQKKYSRPPLCRFDIVAVIGEGKTAIISHISNAFEAPERPYKSRNPWMRGGF